MRQSTRFWIGLAFLSAATAFSASLPPDGMALISNGVYRPLFADDSGTRETHVKSFYLDRLPVTVSDYLLFVNANPDWQKSRVKRIFADESYLENWDGDLNPGGNAPPNCAVTCVSWFAARAYAQWKGKRLPTIAEWERAAAASESSPDGASDPEFKRRTLQWYITPNAPLAQVGQRPPNFWGARDLDGLVWEWVVDFNSALVTIAPSADDPGGNGGLFCGAGAQGARNLEDYPAFMRFGFRSSLEANYCIHTLGFRCAKDL
jgi:formylglycine-generating enzyme required for sulfatase activity